MLRSLNLLLFFAGVGFVFSGSAQAAIFPDQIGPYRKASAKPVAAADPALFQEYGFQEAEQADFTGPSEIGRAHV